MKIYADKIEDRPFYGLRAPEVRRILAAVPPEWLADLKDVRLSNALQRPDFAYFHRYDGSLTIYARGRSAEDLIAPILTELAAHSLGFKYRFGHRLSQAESQRVSLLVQPLAEHLLASTQKPNQALQRTAGWRQSI